MFCSKCGKENSEDARFCFNCGNKLETYTVELDEEIIEEAEGEIVEEEVEKFSEETAIVEQGSVDVEEKESLVDNSKPKKNKFKWIIPLVVIGALVFWLINSEMIFKKDSEYPIVYLKEGGIFVRDETKDKSVGVAQDIFKDKESEKAYYTYGSFVKVTEDGQRMFYLSNVGEEESDLYYLDIVYNKIKNKTDKDMGIQVAKNVAHSYFEISKDGKYVAYLKNMDEGSGSLYISDLNKEEKIASNVGGDFVFSEDCKSILYYTSEDNDYEYRIKSLEGNDKGEKMDSEVEEILLYTPNFEKVYYTKADGYHEDSDYETTYVYMKEKGKGCR